MASSSKLRHRVNIPKLENLNRRRESVQHVLKDWGEDTDGYLTW